MTPLAELSYEQIKAELTEIVQAAPDYVYDFEYCQYFNNDGAPSCLVGHFLANHDITLEDLKDGNDDQVSAILPVFGVDLPETHPSFILLSRIQRYQDCGTPWGESLRLALLDVANG